VSVTAGGSSLSRRLRLGAAFPVPHSISDKSARTHPADHSLTIPPAPRRASEPPEVADGGRALPYFSKNRITVRDALLIMLRRAWASRARGKKKEKSAADKRCSFPRASTSTSSRRNATPSCNNYERLADATARSATLERPTASNWSNGRCNEDASDGWAPILRAGVRDRRQCAPQLGKSNPQRPSHRHQAATDLGPPVNGHEAAPPTLEPRDEHHSSPHLSLQHRRPPTSRQRRNARPRIPGDSLHHHPSKTFHHAGDDYKRALRPSTWGRCAGPRRRGREAGG